ncbi:MAG: DUF5666 domain-containing protein [Pseudomonadota bacterium]
MRCDKNLLLAGLTAATLLLAGCGGGGGSSSTPAAASVPPPAPATGGGSGAPPPANPEPGAASVVAVARGTVTGFGSVFLNGKRYATNSAQFIIDGRVGSQDDLAVGMIINLAGNLEDGIATVVRFDEDIEGPLDAIDGDMLTVFGQTVRLKPDTRFDDDLQQSDLQVGDVLEISGLRDADDALVASYVEREEDDEAYEVIGRVRNLDTTARTFTIGLLTVDYSIAELDDLDDGLANGVLVEVSDDRRVYSTGDLTLLASEVEGRSLTAVIDDDDELDLDDVADDDDQDYLDRYDVGEGAELEIEGLVTEVLAADRFVIDGIEVLITADTEFEYGDSAALVTGVRVEVDGELNGLGQLLAEDVELKDNEGRVAGLIEAVDLDAAELLVFGVRVRITAATDLEDERDEAGDSEDEFEAADEGSDSEGDETDGSEDDEQIVLAELLIGDYVAVEGVIVGDTLYAAEIEVEEADDTSLRGPVTAADAATGTLTILGVELVTDIATEYEMDDEQTIDRDGFFAVLAEGQTLVEAEWDELVTDASVPVAELELED